MKFETSEVLFIVLATNVATHVVTYVNWVYVSIALAVIVWFGMTLLERRRIARRR